MLTRQGGTVSDRPAAAAQEKKRELFLSYASEDAAGNTTRYGAGSRTVSFPSWRGGQATKQSGDCENGGWAPWPGLLVPRCYRDDLTLRPRHIVRLKSRGE